MQVMIHELLSLLSFIVSFFNRALIVSITLKGNVSCTPEPTFGTHTLSISTPFNFSSSSTIDPPMVKLSCCLSKLKLIVVITEILCQCDYKTLIYSHSQAHG